ncbi:GMC family oxidoreductase [Streptomyces sp. NBC_01803]|uniref:GMC family oxidoreductase n=1 Tax=Streptomyces sp. NBC_01803 TaxID=2975946 RepID=UPI002DD7EF32|nr:GMC oxidoreductase [Streptomyces sp. NBC_01803]WSA43310.1 GMC family oxidoreductase N-terminal domain-containing protein [Streptomyces sp. NBC_01803]WSA47353.1 GMC family oxidoreductase N-terminal domain-containing protein [Streptomyces sp. NBC_01803]
MTQHTHETYDVVVVGGGTAGSVIASRLTQNPDLRVCVIEGGPSDVGDERVLNLRNWINLLESELDYDYGTTPQPRGNSHIRHSRAKVLGGCSSHNTLISFLPLPGDFADWEKAGATGWDYGTMLPYFHRLELNLTPVAPHHRNDLSQSFVASASTALGVPVIDDFNAQPFTNGTGFFTLSYDPETGTRSSASVAYLHPHLDRPNLTLLTDTWAYKIDVDPQGQATGVRVRHTDGTTRTIRARHEYVLCAGAIDTPRLLMLSGIGRTQDLRDLGIDTVADVPGVGENLLDHPESLILWEASRPLPPNSAMDADAGLFVVREPTDGRPDLMFHLYQIPFTLHTERLGYDVPEHGFGMTPNIPRPRSTGRMWLTSSDPSVKPALDFRYFTDPEGYDEQTIVDGLRLAREIAATAPFKDWITREIAPGPHLRTDEELSAYGRAAHHTVYHPAGTCRMGSPNDPLTVVDPHLRLRGTSNIRIADASIFPTMPTVNPMIAVLMIGERASDLITDTLT